MASKLYTVCFLLPAIHAGIQINIIASTNLGETDVKMFGFNADIISDVERAAFNLNDKTLKDALLTYYGRRPDNAYLRGPTPWGDVYKTQNWNEVTRTLSPRSAEILSLCSRNIEVSTQVLENYRSKTADFRAMNAQEVEITITSAWKTNGKLKIDQDIRYGFDIKSTSVSGFKEFRYNSKWGNRISKSKTASSGSGVAVTLDPNQSVKAVLRATKITMKVKVDYEASLSGSVAADYADTSTGHHIWSIDLNKVMKSAGLKNSVPSSEVIEFNWFADSSVIIMDPSSNRTLYSIPLILNYDYTLNTNEI